MSVKRNKKHVLIAQIILWLAVLFSAYMAIQAWYASNETGAGAAQGDLGFYLALMSITPVLLIITGIPYLWGLVVDNRNMKSALTSRISILFYINTTIIIWCWYFVLYIW